MYVSNVPKCGGSLDRFTNVQITRYVGTDFQLASHWTGHQPAVILSPVLYFQKISGGELLLLFMKYSNSLFHFSPLF